MRYFIALLIALSSVSSYADVYVVIDKDTDEVISVSNEPDCVVQANMKQHVIKNTKLEDLQLTSQPIYYTFKGNKFEPNFDKLQKKEQEDLKQYTYDQEEYAIKKYTKNKAIDEMISSGVIFKYDHKLK